jgi:glutamine amidotransferase
MRIAVIDYHKGNLSSVARALARAGAEPVVTDDPASIAKTDALVLPGVGAFADAMGYMVESGQAEVVKAAIAEGKAFLGICLGMQLLFSRGDEGAPEGEWVEGLGVLEGSCTRLVSDRLKVPHMGWDQIDVTERGARSRLLAGVPEGCNMYFTHSYALGDDTDPDCVLAYTHYARSFASVVGAGNVYGCQFHPEKSSRTGAVIIDNFVAAARGRA